MDYHCVKPESGQNLKGVHDDDINVKLLNIDIGIGLSCSES